MQNHLGVRCMLGWVVYVVVALGTSRTPMVVYVFGEMFESSRPVAVDEGCDGLVEILGACCSGTRSIRVDGLASIFVMQGWVVLAWRGQPVPLSAIIFSRCRFRRRVP